jgi:hypothetical protein
MKYFLLKFVIVFFLCSFVWAVDCDPNQGEVSCMCCNWLWEGYGDPCLGPSELFVIFTNIHKNPYIWNSRLADPPNNYVFRLTRTGPCQWRYQEDYLSFWFIYVDITEDYGYNVQLIDSREILHHVFFSYFTAKQRACKEVYCNEENNYTFGGQARLLFPGRSLGCREIWDLNEDGIVDLLDYALLLEAYPDGVPTWILASLMENWLCVVYN